MMLRSTLAATASVLMSACARSSMTMSAYVGSPITVSEPYEPPTLPDAKGDQRYGLIGAYATRGRLCESQPRSDTW